MSQHTVFFPPKTPNGTGLYVSFTQKTVLNTLQKTVCDFLFLPIHNIVSFPSFFSVEMSCLLRSTNNVKQMLSQLGALGCVKRLHSFVCYMSFP